MFDLAEVSVGAVEEDATHRALARVPDGVCQRPGLTGDVVEPFDLEPRGGSAKILDVELQAAASGSPAPAQAGTRLRPSMSM